MIGYKIAVGVIEDRFIPVMVTLEIPNYSTVVEPEEPGVVVIDYKSGDFKNYPKYRTDTCIVTDVSPICNTDDCYSINTNDWNKTGYSMFDILNYERSFQLPHHRFCGMPTKYYSGAVVTSALDTDKLESCGSGIHFFASYDVAMSFLNDCDCDGNTSVNPWFGLMLKRINKKLASPKENCIKTLHRILMLDQN